MGLRKVLGPDLFSLIACSSTAENAKAMGDPDSVDTSVADDNNAKGNLDQILQERSKIVSEAFEGAGSEVEVKTKLMETKDGNSKMMKRAFKDFLRRAKKNARANRR